MNQRRICILLLAFFLTTLTHATEDDDDDLDGVTVEGEEQEHVVYEVPYASPIPSDRRSIYLAEHFDDIKKFEKKWVKSQAKKDNIADEISKYDGEWLVEMAKKDSLAGDFGLVLKSKAKHAAIAAKLDKPFIFANKPLIVQYEVNLQDGQECGGAYLKLLSEGVETKDLKQFNDKTPYTIMFGPDKCGNDHKLHFIFRHQNPVNGTLEEKHCRKPKDRLDDYFKDKVPHLYTLIIRPDDTYEVWVDQKIVNSGTLLEDFTPSVNPPAEIDDPNDQKPADWDEREKVADMEAKKPEDWDEEAPSTIADPDAEKPAGWLDDETPMIADPDATQPDDWDAEMDGEWEAPLIDNPKCKEVVGCGTWVTPTIINPAYKGKWRAPLVENPNYKGKWKPRRIPNPNFFEDKHPFKMQTISAIGFELWSMSQDILFDNIIITDDLSVASQWAEDSYELKRKKIAKDSDSFWGRMMVAMNHKPGWWALYFVYCLIPVVVYIWYLRKRVLEESVIQRLLVYAEENPWFWGLYVMAVVVPIVLIVYCCCKSSDKEDKEEVREEYDAAATIKKTDEFTKDDEELEEVEENEERDIEEEDEERKPSDTEETPAEPSADEDDEAIKEEEEEEEEEVVAQPSASGDVPRKRKSRKE